jgi:hypothetical protein
VGRAYAGARVVRKTFAIANLSPELNGLVILHLSDLHLRHYFTLDDLQEILSEATVHRPDLVLVTGDVADDLSLLPEALSMISQVKPRLGCFATMGNHEYFRGPDQVRRHFAGSDVRLLVDESVRLPSGGASILLAGVDDPRSMRGDHTRFFKDRMSWMFSPRLGNEFRLLISHRPDVFPHAAERDINLTLAGHTHGAQIGFAGRSVLESSFPQSYLWGEYRIGECQLYTTCGVGHWFPFRLGCPAEAPIIELRTV